MERRIKGLKWAKRLENRPKCLGAPKRVSGAKAAGVRYEKALAKGLPKAIEHGVWWEFEDQEGKGFCQTDFLWVRDDFVLVMECKYTWTVEAEEKLWGLYVPVVERALRARIVVPVVVCKRLVPGLARPIRAMLAPAIEASYEGASPVSGCAVWHHLGGVPRLREENPIPLDARTLL